MPDRNSLRRYAELSQVGLEMVAPIGLGVLLDYYLGWAPWLSITGAVLGLVGGMYHLIRILHSPSDGPGDEAP